MTGDLPTEDNIHQLRQVEQIMQQLIEMKRENDGRLPPGAREEAANMLQVSIRTIDHYVVRYQESGLMGLIRLRGRRP